MKRNQKNRGPFLATALSYVMAGVMITGAIGVTFSGTPVFFVDAAETDAGALADAADTSMTAAAAEEPVLMRMLAEDGQAQDPGETAEEASQAGDTDADAAPSEEAADLQEEDASRDDEARSAEGGTAEEADTEEEAAGTGADGAIEDPAEGVTKEDQNAEPELKEEEGAEEPGTAGTSGGAGTGEIAPEEAPQAGVEAAGPLAEAEENGEKPILKDGVLTAEVDDVVVSVAFTEAAGLPEGTQVQARRIDPSEDGYAERYEHAVKWVEAKYWTEDPAQEEPAQASGEAGQDPARQNPARQDPKEEAGAPEAGAERAQAEEGQRADTEPGGAEAGTNAGDAGSRDESAEESIEKSSIEKSSIEKDSIEKGIEETQGGTAANEEKNAEPQADEAEPQAEAEAGGPQEEAPAQREEAAESQSEEEETHAAAEDRHAEEEAAEPEGDIAGQQEEAETARSQAESEEELKEAKAAVPQAESSEDMQDETAARREEASVPVRERRKITRAAAVGEGMTDEEAAVLPDLENAEIAVFALFDISLVCDGERIEPQEAVQVTLAFKEKEFSKENDLVMIHYAEDESLQEAAIEALPEQEVTSRGNGSVEASFTADSFSDYAVMALRAGPYTVWFDGTDGMGTGTDMQGRRRNLINGATNVSRTVYEDSVTLPTTAGTSTKYRLNGWYDINSGAYYKPGDTAPISGNTVFYAEWVLADYDLGPAATVVSGQPDISNFVRTDVFDYNEIINAYHGAVLSSSNINQYSHTETWRDSRNTANGSDFLFTNWYNQNFNETNLAFPDNLQSGRNRYAGAGDVTTGIVGSTDDQLIEDLFGLSDAPGKVYLGEGDMLYQYDGNPSSRYYGYYYYDSDKNAADYNRSDGRFYVYTGTQTIRGQWNDNGTNVTGFMPFERGTATINQKTGEVDFWFGMVSTVNFFLPDEPGSGGNKATGGKDMEFYFSGDDDVWVFVDGVLLLDLGGIHREINGSINFSDGNIYVEGRKVGEIPDSIRSGDHELKFYYLERGSSWSNASIYFNIAPRFSLELTKADADDTGKVLEGAVFNVYADANCTIPAYLWTSQEAYEAGEPAVSTFTTDGNGRVGGYGLYSNRTYYLREVSSPPGYPSISDRVIALRLNANGDAVIADGSDIAALTQDGATKHIDLSVVNELPETIEVPVEKHWYNEDGSQLDASGEEEITVELYRAAFDVPTGGSGSGGSGSGGSGTGGSGSGGNTGAVLPVNIRTQFFNVSSNGNGSNTDTSQITAGNLTASTIVTSGGKLTLALDVTASNAGIYAVTANGRLLQPSETSGRCAQNCLIGGRWGNYPPTHAVYEIDPVTEALDIRVTLIGYLEYGGSPWHADTAYSMNISAEVTEPAAEPEEPEPSPEPGPGGEGGEAPEIPSVMPEDAEYVDTLTLNHAGEWRGIFTDLPARSEDGTKIYVYYVKEIYPDGYSTSYIGNGSTGGTVSIYNVRQRELSLKKEWEDSDGTPLEEGLPESIELKLTQYDETDGTQRDIQVTLTAAEGWTKKWRSSSAVLNEQDGHSYRYRVTEVNAGGSYQVTYSDNNAAGVSEGTIVVTNRKKDYSIDFVKSDSTAHYKGLQGAVFSIYTDPACDEAHIVRAYDSQEEGAEPKTAFTSGEGGRFSVYGLKPGTYYLKEISAPDGYYMIGYPLEVVVTDEAGGAQSVRGVRLVDGELVPVTDEASRIELVGGSLLQVFLYDSPLYELPSTGSTGSLLYILGGMAVMAATLLLYIKSGRKEDM